MASSWLAGRPTMSVAYGSNMHEGTKARDIMGYPNTGYASSLGREKNNRRRDLRRKTFLPRALCECGARLWDP